MSHVRAPITDDGFEAVVRTGRAVRAANGSGGVPIRRWPRWAGAVFAAAAGMGVIIGQPTPIRADGAADSDLSVLTNQDRASNGVGALTVNTTLSNLGEATPYTPCGNGQGVAGRSQDMINRQYWSHQIPPCNVYVFTMMNQAGVKYQSAGENIGWVASIQGDQQSTAANWINTSFMNSPEHRQNILNPSYTDLGIGSAFTATPWNYPGGAGPYTNVWMFSEEFAQLASAPPPRPPVPVPAPPPPRNSPIPPAPQLTPVQTAAPTPAPTPTALPSPTPAPVAPLEPLPPLPLIYQGGGLLSDSVESVLESYLIN